MSLSDYFRSQADWRRQKAEEYPEDERNAQSAAALESLAEYVEPDEHGEYEAGPVIDRLLPHLADHGMSLGGEETARAVSRYGFGYPVSTRQHRVPRRARGALHEGRIRGRRGARRGLDRDAVAVRT